MIKASKLLLTIGYALIAAPLISELELESRVGSNPIYTTANATRTEAIDFHGSHYFVSEVDWWRNKSIPYVLLVGAVVILLGHKFRDES